MSNMMFLAQNGTKLQVPDADMPELSLEAKKTQKKKESHKKTKTDHSPIAEPGSNWWGLQNKWPWVTSTAAGTPALDTAWLWGMRQGLEAGTKMETERDTSKFPLYLSVVGSVPSSSSPAPPPPSSKREQKPQILESTTLMWVRRDLVGSPVQPS